MKHSYHAVTLYDMSEKYVTPNVETNFAGCSMPDAFATNFAAIFPPCRDHFEARIIESGTSLPG